jgi:hypothetical protein
MANATKENKQVTVGMTPCGHPQKPLPDYLFNLHKPAKQSISGLRNR